MVTAGEANQTTGQQNQQQGQSNDTGSSQ